MRRQATALTRWFGIGVKPMTAGSALMLESKAKLPVELAIERRDARRSGSSRPSSTWRRCRRSACPIACGALRRSTSSSAAASPIAPTTECRSIASTSVYAAGEIAHMSYDAQLSTNRKGMPTALGCAPIAPIPTAACSARSRRPISASAMSPGFDSRLTGSSASGRGAVDHQPPADRPGARSTAPASKAICRPAGKPKSTATASCSASPSRPPTSAIVFDDVQLLYGENQIRHRPLRPAGPGPDARGDDQRRPGQRPARQDLVLGRRQPARPRPRHHPQAARRLGPAQGASQRFGRAWHRRAHVGRRAGARDAGRRRAADLRRRHGPALDRPRAGRGRRGPANRAAASPPARSCSAKFGAGQRQRRSACRE